VEPWSEAVKRSLITLKALTHAPTGGIVAAATTSLPERLGGFRKCDYRYCWLRDATFTLLAFMHLGYYEEARAWRDWLIRSVAGSPEQIQIVYGVGGERWLPELVVPWLPGHESSSPARIGNAAHQQLQLEVFGESADAMLDTLKIGIPVPERGRALRPVMLDYQARAWRQPELVDNYILQERYAEARRLFDRLLSRCNDVGLLSEEFDLTADRMLGNFPQAYSHVGLIKCALNLSRQTGPMEERAESEALPPLQGLVERP
jgi:GH15 family glucan-1,4-alpha-glucosidase